MGDITLFTFGPVILRFLVQIGAYCVAFTFRSIHHALMLNIILKIYLILWLVEIVTCFSVFKQLVYLKRSYIF